MKLGGLAIFLQGKESMRADGDDAFFVSLSDDFGALGQVIDVCDIEASEF